MLKALAIITALGGAGCLRQTLYKCETNDQCNAGGVCESTGYCSFTDTGCADGRRYGDLSGTYSGKCVGEVIAGDDARPIDMAPPLTDTMADTPVVNNCPGTYTSIGGSTKRYRVISANNTWANQASACDADGANTYLAVPDSQAELDAVIGAAGEDIWLGVSDMATEGTFATTNNGTLASNSPLWSGGEPDNDPESGGGNNNGDCVVALDANDRLYDDRCDNQYGAVCECDP